MFELGTKVKDQITKFSGIVTARTVFLNSEPRIMVEGMDTTGRPIEWWFDEERLEEIKES